MNFLFVAILLSLTHTQPMRDVEELNYTRHFTLWPLSFLQKMQRIESQRNTIEKISPKKGVVTII